MKTVIPHYDRAYGDLEPGIELNYIFSEPMSKVSQRFAMIVPPHVHDKLFHIFCIHSGKILFRIDSVDRELIAPFIIIIPPLVIHGLKFSKDANGRALTIADSYLESAFPSDSGVLALMSEPQIICDFSGPQKFRWFNDLLKQIEDELYSDLPERQLMIKALLGRLFVAFHRVAGSESGRKKRNPYFSHLLKFLKLIKSANKIKSVNEFADELNITPIHLNRVCKTVTGKSAIQLVQEHSIMEAKKYLKYTTMTINEIAYVLGFEYPNYFARLFKKHTGITPLEYRNSVP